MNWVTTASEPRNEAPVGIQPFGELGRSDSAFVAITAVQVFTTGLSFELSVRLRQEPKGFGHRISELINGNARGRQVPAEHQLWFGVEYPDGRTATSVESGADGTGLRLWSSDGHGQTR